MNIKQLKKERDKVDEIIKRKSISECKHTKHFWCYLFIGYKCNPHGLDTYTYLRVNYCPSCKFILKEEYEGYVWENEHSFRYFEKTNKIITDKKVKGYLS